MKNSRRIAAGALVVLVAATTAACSSGSTPDPAPTGEPSSLEELITAAQDEGELTFYGDANETSLQSWTEGFTEEYNIPVNILRLPGSELNQRFAQEMSASQYQADIFSIADRVSMEAAVEEGWIAEYTPANGDLYPAEQVQESPT